MKVRTRAAALLATVAVAAVATMWADSAGPSTPAASSSGQPGGTAPGGTAPGGSPSGGPGSEPTASTSPAAPASQPNQPNQPILPDLMPGQAPPQFVVFSWDGSGEDSHRLFSRFRAVAKANSASMTYFLSGVYTLPQSHRMVYQPPRHARGASDIPFLADRQVAATMQEVRLAWLDGSEIGTHFNGHFCGPGGGGSWTVQEWATELRQARQLMADWRTNTGMTSTPPLPFDVNREVIGGRAPCLEGQENLVPAAVAAGFRYDASSPGGRQVWPGKLDGIWNFPLQALPVPWMKHEVLSMDYNFMANQSKVTQGDPAKFPLWQKQTRDAFVDGFNRAYTTNRAPMFIGNHFENWNGGIYLKAVAAAVSTICSKPYVHCVSFRQLADWMDRQDPGRLAALRTLGVGQGGDWTQLLK